MIGSIMKGNSIVGKQILIYLLIKFDDFAFVLLSLFEKSSMGVIEHFPPRIKFS